MNGTLFIGVIVKYRRFDQLYKNTQIIAHESRLKGRIEEYERINICRQVYKKVTWSQCRKCELGEGVVGLVRRQQEKMAGVKLVTKFCLVFTIIK
ncbi:MAG: hypothetical protein AMS27_09745 [Bacteroides sp. SM23_62_1]|nr:MAG: hypothetical protein AMS27_09745 [Bacteroides sp. SM23_62_1]